MTRPIIPSSSAIIAPSIAKFVELNPKAFNSINLGQGYWSNIFAGFRSQADTALSRMAEGVVGNNLKLASGDQLHAYVKSEFEEPPVTGQTKAIGMVLLDRTSSTAPKNAGVIQKGKKFRRDPVVDAPLPVTAAEYQVINDVPVDAGQNVVFVNIESVRPGASSNTPKIPSGYTYPNVTLSDSLFDTNFKPTFYEVAGGSDGVSDAEYRRYATMFAKSDSGPTDDAIKLAALRVGGVRRVLLQDNTLYIADSSWGSSTYWCSVVKQAMLNDPDDILGYSVRFNVYQIASYPVSVALTVRLRDTAFLSDTTDLSQKISAVVKNYFDERDNFHIINNNAIAALVTRADKRILRCPSVALHNLDGSPYTPHLFSHTLLNGNSATITYLPPV